MTWQFFCLGRGAVRASARMVGGLKGWRTADETALLAAYATLTRGKKHKHPVELPWMCGCLISFSLQPFLSTVSALGPEILFLMLFLLLRLLVLLSLFQA